MKNQLSMLAAVLVALFFAIPAAPQMHAQITNEIRAHIDHSFTVGDTTLPPGEYTFQILPGSDQSAMTVTSENDKTSVVFNVRTTIDDHTPHHTQLTFRKYGNTEFLNKVFESGTKTGEEVTETGREEARLVKQGMQPTLQNEEQP